MASRLRPVPLPVKQPGGGLMNYSSGSLWKALLESPWHCWSALVAVSCWEGRRMGRSAAPASVFPPPPTPSPPFPSHSLSLHMLPGSRFCLP